MTKINAGTINVFVLTRAGDAWRVLALQRSANTRCPAAWEIVHGRIEAGEDPETAALRELREETGLSPQRLYSIRVQPFYLAATKTVEVSVGFAAVVSESASITLGDEHQAYEWLAPADALTRFAWPSERTGIGECLAILANGDAGPLEDVLRVC